MKETGWPVNAMEYVRGETLSKLLETLSEADPETVTVFGRKDTRAYFDRLAEAFADVAEGLQHAHSKGVVHRDIKPSNLIYAEDGKLRILDFGLARLEGHESLTLSGHIVGTPLYMSPEQARGKKSPVDHRTDVYSLGATMYETFAGRPPFHGEEHSDTLSQVIEREPVEPRRLNPRIPADLETIVLKCLQKEPNDRYGTAEALGQDLGRCARGDPVEARPASEWRKLSRRLRHHRRTLLAAAVVALLIVAAGWSIHKRRLAELNARRAAYDTTVREAIVEFNRGALTLSGSELHGLAFFSRRRYRAATESASREVAPLLEKLSDVAEVMPERPEAHYYRAKLLLLLGRVEEAGLAAKRSLENHPDFVPAEVLLKEIASEELHLGGEALEALASRYRGTGGWQDAWLRAYRSFTEKDWSAAATAYAELLAYREREREPYLGNAIEASMGRGISALRGGRYDLAIREFSGARRLWPGFWEAALLVGLTYLRRGGEGDHDEAESVFLELYSDGPAETKDERAEWIAAVCWTNRSWERVGEWSERISDWRRHRFRAYVSLFAWRCDECILESRAALQGDPEDLSSLTCLGFARLMLQRDRYGPEWDAERADLLAHARKTAALYPRSDMAQSLFAQALLASGRAEEALTVARRISAIDRRWANSGETGRWTEVLILQRAGRLEEAMKLITRALEIVHPKNVSANLILRHTVAETLDLAGDTDAARGEYEALVKSDPTWAAPRGGLARLLLRQGDLDGAVEHAGEATSLHPKNTPAYEILAEALWKRGENEAALEAVDTGLEKLPGRVNLHLLRARILEDSGAIDGAARSYTEALALHPEYVEAHEALARLLDQHKDSLPTADLIALRARLETRERTTGGRLLREAIGLLSRAIRDRA